MSDPAPESTQPTPASPNQDFAEKLLLVERQRQEEAQRRADESSAARERIEQLAREVQEIKSSGNAKPAVDPHNPLASIPESDLYRAHAEADDVESKRVAMNELLRRAQEKTKEEMRREHEVQRDRDRELADTWQTIRNKYGDEMVKEGSELNKLAERHMNALQKRYGAAVALDPKAQILAASMANEERLRAQVASKQEVERERDELKRRASMERGNQSIHRPDDDTKALFKKGKVKEGIKSLGLYGRLFGEG